MFEINDKVQFIVYSQIPVEGIGVIKKIIQKQNNKNETINLYVLENVENIKGNIDIIKNSDNEIIINEFEISKKIK